MIGKAVEHMFEMEDGPKEEWRGMVLAQAPIMTSWFYITYEKDPVLYMYQLLDDYKEGDLRIMPDSSEYRARGFCGFRCWTGRFWGDLRREDATLVSSQVPPLGLKYSQKRVA